MKYLFIALSALLIFPSCQGQTVSDFNWLLGTWQRENTKQGTTATEYWVSDAEGMAGQGITLQGSDTVFVENLKIQKKEGDLFYVAEVAHNPAPTFFKIVTYGKNEFSCENPSHDFPKRIDYTLEGDRLTVVISGDGKAVPFRFKKL